jgi:hypothetical protein
MQRRPRASSTVGPGLGIMPCFIGDADPGLVRLTAPIAELTDERWRFVHPDLRHVIRVRRVINWIRATFRDNRPALLGLPRRAGSSP